MSESSQPERVTVQDLIDYHKAIDKCWTCERGKWWCASHQFAPREVRPRNYNLADYFFSREKESKE